MRTLLALSVLSFWIGAPAFADANEMTPFELEGMIPMERLDEKSRFPDDLGSEADVLVIENMDCLVEPRWDARCRAVGIKNLKFVQKDKGLLNERPCFRYNA